jgi:predicted nuclease of restriction endonuclease-like RecB superfamily
MLKSELVRPRLVMQAGQVSTRPIPADYHYLAVANELASLFQRHLGRTRGELVEALREYEGDSLDYPVIRGLAAVLEGQCIFGAPLLDGRDPQLKPAELRTALFHRGPVTDKPDLFAPLTREQVLKEAAAEFGLSAGQVEAAMFADLVEEQVLLGTGPSIAPVDLIARYNLELARGLLYWAREMRIVVRDSYKDVFRYVKLFKLMYEVRPDLSPGPSPARGGEFSPSRVGKGGGGLGPNAYHITLFGPISPFVKSTQRYGVQFAKFLPALMLCSSWQMEADVHPPGAKGLLRYTLDDSTELRTHFRPSGEFDSRLEADFAAEFEAKYGGAKRKWELAR